MNPVWYRSWPEAVPEGRAYVHDSLPRLVMRDCHYATVADNQPWPTEQPGWFMLEWDIALDRVERARFAEHALETPDRVLVAPYMVFKHRLGPKPRMVHRVLGSPISDGQKWCDTFGFGCIYFPQQVLERWWREMPYDRSSRWFNDVAFSTWYRSKFGQTAVDWSVHPQHLHGD